MFLPPLSSAEVYCASDLAVQTPSGRGTTAFQAWQTPSRRVSNLSTPTPHCSAPRRRRKPLQMRHSLEQDSVEDVRNLLENDPLAAVLPLKDRGCEAPILAAAHAGCSSQIIVELLRHGAVVNDVDRDGLTALDIVVRRATPTQANTTRRFLDPQPPILPAGVGLLVTLPPRQFPALGLQVAVSADGVPEHELLEVAACLLSFGATSTGSPGHTAADRAEQLGYLKLASLIEYWGGLGDLQRLHIVARQASRSSSGVSKPCFASLLPSLLNHMGGWLVPAGLHEYCLRDSKAEASCGKLFSRANDGQCLGLVC